LRYVYPDGTVALDGVDLEVPAGELVALVGQNGSGKTTLAKCLNGLLTPTEGHVRIGDLDTRTAAVGELVTAVGYVFQNPDHQLFNSSVERELRYALDNIHLPRDQQDERISEAARIAGVRTDDFDEHPYFLPKGIRQRVAIASILALRPQVIIVDEPTTGQDARQSVDVMDFLERICREEGRTIVVVTHEMWIVARYAQRVIAMHEGHLLLEGTTDEVLGQADLLARTCVELPQLTRLGQRLDPPPSSPLRTAEQMIAELRSRLPAGGPAT
jgi:energy-coupling factor transport system ATP-binding protein